jgi:hypothetical protein
MSFLPWSEEFDEDEVGGEDLGIKVIESQVDNIAALDGSYQPIKSVEQ